MALLTPKLRRRLRTAMASVAGARSISRERREVRDWAAALPGLSDDLSRLERPGALHVLIVSLTQDAEQIQLESILAKAMQARGARVTALVFGNLYVRRRFRALGVKRLAYYEDFVPPRSTWAPLVAPLIGEAADLLAYRDLTYRSARVGRHALSTVVRERHEPRVDPDDPEVREALARHVGHGMEGAHVAEALLDDIRPDVLLMIERGYVGVGAIFDIALERGLPVIQLQSSHRDDAFTLKRYRLESRDVQPRSISPKTWDELLGLGLTPAREGRLEAELAERETGKWFLAKRVKHSDRRRSSAGVRRDLGLDADRKVAVLFSHVLWDASMFYGTDLYPDQGKWFAETLRLAAQDDRVQWLVKLHPALLWKLRHDRVSARPVELDIVQDVVGDLPPHMRLLMPDDDVATVDLFSFIDAGVTIRGTVGIELPSLGIPVLTAGTSDYTGRGFTVDAATIDEYERNVRGIADLPRLSDEQVRLARLYAYGIFCRRPWRFDSFSLDYLPVDEAGDTLEHRMSVYARTSEALVAAPDLTRFGRWAVETDDTDYVEPEVDDAA